MRSMRVAVWLSITLLANLIGCQHGPTLRPAGDESPTANCIPGQPLLALSYLPSKIMLTPDRRSLLVLDAGYLGLRDLATLKLTRILQPRIDRWQWAEFSPDGGRLTAGTLDRMKFEFSTSDWSARRLPDDRGPDPLKRGSALLEEGLYNFNKLASDPTGWAKQNADSGWQEFRRRRDLPKDVLQGASPTALTSAVTEVIVADSEGMVRLMASETGAIVKAVKLPGKPQITQIQRDADGFLAATAAGEVLVLDSKLHVVSRAQVLLPTSDPGDDFSASPAVRLLWLSLGPGREDPKFRDSADRQRAFQYLQALNEGTIGAAPPSQKQEMIIGMVRLPDRDRLVWISSSFELGLFDLKTGAHIVRLPSTGLSGVASAIWTSETEVTLLADRTLRVWNVQTQAQRALGKGPYFSAAALDGGRVLASTSDGFAEVLNARDGQVERRLCLIDPICVEKPVDVFAMVRKYGSSGTPMNKRQWTAFQQNLLPRRVRVFSSPNGRYVVAVQAPAAVDESEEEPAVPGRISLWDRAQLKQLANKPWPAPCKNLEEPRFSPDGQLGLCGQWFEVPTLQPSVIVPTATPDQSTPQVFAQGNLQVQLLPLGDADDSMHLRAIKLLGPGGAPLGQLAGPVQSAHPGEDSEHRRGALRTETLVNFSKSGRSFLLAGAAEVLPYSLHTYGYTRTELLVPSGDVELWCAPTAPLPALPAQPALPRRLVIDEVEEVELPELPARYRQLATNAQGRFVLASEEKGENQVYSLWQLPAELGGLAPPRRLELPEGKSGWDQLVGHAHSGVLWLLSKDRNEVARRELEGTWQRFDLSDQLTSAAAIVALPSGEAVLQASYPGKSPAQPKDPPSQAELLRFYDEHLSRFQTPEQVVLDQIVLKIKTDETAAAKKVRLDQARQAAPSILAALGQAGADLGAVRSRATALGLQLNGEKVNFKLDMDNCNSDEEELRDHLRIARKGDLVGPWERHTDSGIELVLLRVRERTSRRIQEFAKVLPSVLEEATHERAHPHNDGLWVLGPRGVKSSRRLGNDLSLWRPPVIVLPDGFITARAPRLRYRNGQWSESDPLLKALSPYFLGDATAGVTDGQLYSLDQRGNWLHVHKIADGRLIREAKLCLNTQIELIQKVGMDRIRILSTPGTNSDGTIDSASLSLFDLNLTTLAMSQVPWKSPSWLRSHIEHILVEGDALWFQDQRALLRLQDRTSSAWFHPQTRNLALQSPELTAESADSPSDFAKESANRSGEEL